MPPSLPEPPALHPCALCHLKHHSGRSRTSRSRRWPPDDRYRPAPDHAAFHGLPSPCSLLPAALRRVGAPCWSSMMESVSFSPARRSMVLVSWRRGWHTPSWYGKSGDAGCPAPAPVHRHVWFHRVDVQRAGCFHLPGDNWLPAPSNT